MDIFPDLTAPTVTVITEAKGLAPEELELLVTFPVESALNGASGVRRIRSVSGPGIAVVWVEFEWGEDVYLARQIVAERLQTVALPSGVERPTLGPISSIMGEITFIALTSDKVSAMELRRLAETVVRRSLLAVPGISQVVPIGGEVREYLVELDPAAVVQAGISVEEVVTALECRQCRPRRRLPCRRRPGVPRAWPWPRPLDHGPCEHRAAGPGRDPAAAGPDRFGRSWPPSPRGVRPPTAPSPR